MSEGSSHHGDTTGSTYTDLGATTEEAFRISLESRTLARRVLGDRGPEDRVRQRCSVAVGDFSMAGLMRFSHDPVTAGVRAIREGAPIIADIRMVQAGIQRRGHRCEILCALDHGQDLAEEKGITRTSAGLIALAGRMEDAVLVIGNAPTALLTACGMIRRQVRPALVIGTPVGFVKAAESKEELRLLDIPSISTVGPRGGTPVAVAAINELITIVAEGEEPGT
jgi:precorrin-8X/cobalt-precorrin-8 methylmutase